jgi:hypothetical protein
MNDNLVRYKKDPFDEITDEPARLLVALDYQPEMFSLFPIIGF